MKKLPWLIVFLFIAFIFYNSSLNGVESSGMSDPIALWLKQWFSISLPMDTITFIIRKLAHFSEYALLGILVYYAHQKAPLFHIKQDWVLALFLIIPIIDENIQRFSLGRSCEIRDMLIDGSGILFGFAFAYFVYKKLFQGGKQNVTMES